MLRSRVCSVLLTVLVSLGAAACGSSGDEPPGSSGGAGGAAGSGGVGGAAGSAGSGGAAGARSIPFACPGGTIADGANTLTIDGTERTFYADLPEHPTGKVGVVFSWHGYGDTAENHRAALHFEPDGDPAHPLIVMTPVDSGLEPLGAGKIGLAWDIRAGKPGDDNVDFPFFEAMLGCVAAQQPLDPARVYSFGFSAGSVFTSLLASRYPRLFAATVHESGAWMNDPAEAALVKVLTIDWSWPELEPADRGNVLLTHGGTTDEVGAGSIKVFNLEESAKAALPFLAAAKRTVIDCEHDGGHVLHPELTSALILKYLTLHRAGEGSPFVSGALEGFPGSCSLHLP
ncbi:MAG: hypothetical protein OZ921_06515 [Sorangiineae bacterium]|nr:hypothetical protein [Polyangiaceae bacterium]MEB2322147.1 hypothetical protein [Sorangiineae bacterium]